MVDQITTDCWDKFARRVKRVWKKVSKRMALRKSEHVKLHQDVLQCEYEDVHILWDMLKKKDVDLSRSSKSRPFWDLVEWAKHAPLICGAAA